MPACYSDCVPDRARALLLAVRVHEYLAEDTASNGGVGAGEPKVNS